MSDEHTQKIPNSDLKRILAQLDSINARLTALEQNAQARAYDTKPIWERALQEIVETRQEVAETRQEIAETRAEMRAGFEKMDVRFEALEQKIEVLADDVLTVRAKYKNIDSRLRHLESEPTR